MRMLRWAGVVTRLDKIRNELFRGICKMAPIQEKLWKNRLRWYGHEMRRDGSYMTRKILTLETGRPPPHVVEPFKGMSLYGLRRSFSLYSELIQKCLEWRRTIRRPTSKEVGQGQSKKERRPININLIECTNQQPSTGNLLIPTGSFMFLM